MSPGSWWKSDEEKFAAQQRKEEEKVAEKQRKLAKADAIARLKAEHEDELQRRERELSNYRRQIHFRDAEITKAERKLEQAEVRHQGAIENLNVQHQRAIDDVNETNAIYVGELAQTAEKREKQLIAQHAEQMARLRKEVDDINTALLTRDDEIYQGMVFTASGLPEAADSKIRDDFLGVHEAIEQIARRPWRPDQNIWPQHLIARISTHYTEERVKEIIAQDAIWSLLYVYVFCSPFRIFGAAGTQLEQEWNAGFGNNDPKSDDIYRWPVPTVKSERWRFMTLKECRVALTDPVSSVDPRAAVKDGYKDGLERLIEQLISVLVDVFDVTDSDVVAVQRLARKAVRLWLDFGLHRCRIRIQLPGMISTSMAEKAALAQNRSLTLTATSSVGRYGNVEGVGLESFTEIGGCSGDHITVP